MLFVVTDSELVVDFDMCQMALILSFSLSVATDGLWENCIAINNNDKWKSINIVSFRDV